MTANHGRLYRPLTDVEIARRRKRVVVLLATTYLSFREIAKRVEISPEEIREINKVEQVREYKGQRNTSWTLNPKWQHLLPP